MGGFKLVIEQDKWNWWHEAHYLVYNIALAPILIALFSVALIYN